MDVGRKLDKADRDGIQLVAQHLQRLGALNFATEMYRKLGEEKSVVLLHVEARDWKEAFALADRHPEFRDLVYVPYAEWLAEKDKFVEAQRGECIRLLNKIVKWQHYNIGCREMSFFRNINILLKHFQLSIRLGNLTMHSMSSIS